MFFYIVLTYLPLPVYEVPAIHVNTTKSMYTFTSVIIDFENELSVFLRVAILHRFYCIQFSKANTLQFSKTMIKRFLLIHLLKPAHMIFGTPLVFRWWCNVAYWENSSVNKAEYFFTLISGPKKAKYKQSESS